MENGSSRLSDSPKDKKTTKKKREDSAKIHYTINSDILIQMMDHQAQLLRDGKGYHKLTDILNLIVMEYYDKTVD